MPNEKATAIAALPPEYLLCRDLQHCWAPHDVRYEGRTLIRVLKCRVCPTKREQQLNSSFRFTRSRHDYSDCPDYLLKGFGRLTQADRALIRRASTEQCFGAT